MSKEAMKLALDALVRSRKAVSGDLDLAGCAYGKNDPDGHRYADAKTALVTLDKAIKALREALAEQPASKPWVGLTDDDKCVKELYESDTDPEWIDGYTAGLKDAENKLRRYNAQPALVVEQLNPVAEVKLKQQGGNAGFATVINEIYDPMREPLRVGDKLYTSPPAQRKPLTDHQTMSMTFNHHWLTSMTLRDAYRLGIRDAEAAHNIKENT